MWCSPPPDKRGLGGYFEINVLWSEMMVEVQSCHQSQLLSWHKEHPSIGNIVVMYITV